MAKLGDLMPGRFFRAEDVKTPRVVTIKSIDRQNTASEGKPAELKAVIKFEEDDRGCVLNGERAESLKEIFGTDDTDDFIGKKITLTQGKTTYQGKKVPCVAIAAA